MVLRKGRLQRPCSKCGKSFEPNGKSQKICVNCKPKSFLNELARLQHIKILKSGKRKVERKD